MLFHEVYGAYYDCVAALIEEAQRNTLTDGRLREIVRERAFPESQMEIPRLIKSGAWPFLRPDGTTPVRHPVSAPLTLLQKRWLKSLLTDPRVRLFDVDDTGLEDAEPLFTQDQLVWYDRFSDGDPWDDADYRSRFRVIREAIRTHRAVAAVYRTHRDRQTRQEVWPEYLEYSAQDDKLRLVSYDPKTARTTVLNLGRMLSCELSAHFDPEKIRKTEDRQKRALVELRDTRNALERAMLRFSHLAKKTERLGDSLYRITLSYRPEDETELLIQLMSFGPVLKVLEPPELAAQLRERLLRQLSLQAKTE